MKNPTFVLFAWLCGTGLLICSALPSCNGRVPGEQEADTILQKPPYNAITDSIAKATASDPLQKAGLYFRRGELLTRNNFHEMAAEDYRRSWDLHADEATALRYASSLSITGHTDEAIRVLKDGHSKFPADESFLRWLAELYIQSGRTNDALSLYDQMLKTDSLNFEAWYERALLLEKAGDTTGAIVSLKKAYGIEPVNTYGLELAHLYAEKGNALALALCDDVLRKDSTKELLDPLFIKGIYYANTGQDTRAVVQFDSCIRRDWKFTDAYLEKGIILFRHKQITQAMDVFNMTVTVSNTYPDGYYWVGRCYEAEGRRQEAILYYQQALALDRNFTEAAEHIKHLK